MTFYFFFSSTRYEGITRDEGEALKLKQKDTIKIHWNESPGVTNQRLFDAKITKVYTPTKTLGNFQLSKKRSKIKCRPFASLTCM